MKANDIFNFRRFGKYFASDLRTCWANYGLSLLTISTLFPVGTYFLTNTFNLVLNSTWDGPDIGLRSFIFIVATICMVVTILPLLERSLIFVMQVIVIIINQ